MNNNNIKKTLTKVIISEIMTSVSKKSKGTKIATNERVIPIITIKPFSK